MTNTLRAGGIWKSFFTICSFAALGACSPESNIAASGLSAVTAEVAAFKSPSPMPAVAAPAPVKAQPASASNFAIKSILKPDQRLDHGDFMWEEEGVPAGPLAIVVDLNAQILYVYRGGVEMARAAILYGADDKPTPTGTFPIMQKKVHHVSNLYGAPMPYMMRLTNDGIAIHASEVEWGSATHGCVGLPMEFAKMLFEEARLGDKVLITKGWRTDIYRP